MASKRKNPIILLLMAFILLLSLSAVLLYITYSKPGALLSTPPEFSPQQIYRFEPWSFSFGDQDFDFPRGGIIIPALHDGEQWGIFISAQGRVTGPKGAENISSMFLVTEPGQLDALKGGTLFLPVEDPVICRQYNRLFSRQVIYPRANLFGFETSILPGTEEYVLYTYSPDSLREMHYSLPILNFSATYYLTAILMLLVISYIITLDIEDDHRQSYCCYPWQKYEKLILPALVIATAALRYFLSGFWLAVGFALPVFLLALLKLRRLLPPLNLGLTMRHLFRSACTGIIVSFLFLLFIAPFSVKDITIPAAATLWQPALLGILIALGQELVIRGYIQTTVERLLDKPLGLAITALALTAIDYLFFAFMWEDPFILAIISLLATSFGLHLLAGFIYQQGENISGPVLLHWLLVYLPPLFL